MGPYTTRSKLFRETLPPNVLTESRVYDLASVIVHIGEINSGHYISYSKSDSRWFKFDDNKVNLASENDILKANAYMLFYVVKALDDSK
jgi:ubiquitin carboxyl-terminal hydrolase 22/27/51